MARTVRLGGERLWIGAGTELCARCAFVDIHRFPRTFMPAQFTLKRLMTAD